LLSISWPFSSPISIFLANRALAFRSTGHSPTPSAVQASRAQISAMATYQATRTICAVIAA
jgi:hypothetical protein